MRTRPESAVAALESHPDGSDYELALGQLGTTFLLLVWLWYIYRHVRGLIALINGEPMPR